MHINYMLAKVLQNDYLRDADRERLARKLRALRKQASNNQRKS